MYNSHTEILNYTTVQISSKSRSSPPVSYTHLDVYKRQVYNADFFVHLSQFMTEPNVLSIIISNCSLPSLTEIFNNLDHLNRYLVTFLLHNMTKPVIHGNHDISVIIINISCTENLRSCRLCQFLQVHINLAKLIGSFFIDSYILYSGIL